MTQHDTLATHVPESLCRIVRVGTTTHLVVRVTGRILYAAEGKVPKRVMVRLYSDQLAAMAGV